MKKQMKFTCLIVAASQVRDLPDLTPPHTVICMLILSRARNIAREKSMTERGENTPYGQLCVILRRLQFIHTHGRNFEKARPRAVFIF